MTAAALFRRGPRLCVRCIHRELCRLVWRPQTALFGSKPSDRKQPRRTHIKKAKPQPAVDVAKLLEQLFSQRRPDTAPPAGKARPVNASSIPPTTSSMKVSTSDVPPLSKTEPTVSVCLNTAPLSPQPTSPTNPKTLYSSETPQQAPFDFIQESAADSVSNGTVRTTSTTPAPSGSEAAAIEITIETNVETAPKPDVLTTVLPLTALMLNKNVETSSFSAAVVEPLIETSVEPSLSPVDTLEVIVVKGPVEPTVDAPAEEVQTKATASGVVEVSHAAKEEPLIETTIESPVEDTHFPMETLETRAAAVEGQVEPTIDVTVLIAAEKVQTKSTDSGVVDISHTVEPFYETTVETSVEASASALETLKSRDSFAGPVETTVDATVDPPAQAVLTNSTDSGPVNLPHAVQVEPLLEITIKGSVETGTSPLETLESRAAVAEGSVETTIEAEADTTAQAVVTKSTDSGVADISHTVQSLLETTVETSVEASASPLETFESRAAVAEGSVETTIEAEADTAAQAVQTNSTDSAAVNVSYCAKEDPSIETTIEPAVVARPSTIESRDAVSEGTIEPKIENEAADNLSHTALIQKAQESALLPLRNEVESKIESTVEKVALEEGVNKCEQITLEPVTLHVVKVTTAGAGYKAAAETENPSEFLSKVVSKWDSLSEDVKGLEGRSGALVKELLCHVPAVLSKTPGTLNTSSYPPVGDKGDYLQMEEKATEAEAVTLELITLAKVEAEVGGVETEVLLETRNALEKVAELLAENMEVKTTIEDAFEDTTEADISTLESISEATDALEAETSAVLEAMLGSEQGQRQPPDTLLVDQKLGQQDEVTGQGAEKESGEQDGSVMTLGPEVEASLGTLENESLSKTTDYLEKEAESLAGEKKTEVEDRVASEGTTEALKMESLPEGDALSEALETDVLFSVPGYVTGVPEGLIGQKVVRADIGDAEVPTGSVDIGTATPVTDDFPASPTLKEVLLGQEVEEEGAQTEALGIEDGEGTHTDLDPVQRLFLEKIREYNNMRRLNGGLFEAEPDYEKYLSEETAKLQRLYGGGDLSSFPEFTFTEPKMDQDSK